jgi:hypothetical protein
VTGQLFGHLGVDLAQPWRQLVGLAVADLLGEIADEVGLSGEVGPPGRVVGKAGGYAGEPGEWPVR